MNYLAVIIIGLPIQMIPDIATSFSIANFFFARKVSLVTLRCDRNARLFDAVMHRRGRQTNAFHISTFHRKQDPAALQLSYTIHWFIIQRNVSQRNPRIYVALFVPLSIERLIGLKVYKSFILYEKVYILYFMFKLLVRRANLCRAAAFLRSSKLEIFRGVADRH